MADGTSRFASPTSGFRPDELLGPLRKVFWSSFCLAALLHLALVAIDPFKERAAKAPKPMTTKFIKREPRLTKPLELRKIPQPRRQMVRREVRLTAARMDRASTWNPAPSPGKCWPAAASPRTRSTWRWR